MRKEPYLEAADLLMQVLTIPSFSGEEDQLCTFLEHWLVYKGYLVRRKNNNIWIESVINKNLPTILLNTHLDTIKPTSAWTRDPFIPEMEDGKVYGLGSNDSGASIVSLIFTFIHLDSLKDREFNVILALSSEEETSGQKGIYSIIPDLGKFDVAIIGEPTAMRMAICERGLIVLECHAKGKAGHAALGNGENAILKAFSDIEKLQSLKFDKISELLGEVAISVTQIEGGTRHNIIPDLCKFVVDIRTNEHYTNEEIVGIIRSAISSDIIPTSMHLASSSLNHSHPLVVKALSLGIQTFGSRTLSDQALIPGPTVKIGPGETSRSHKPDEFIYLHEIKEAIDLYIKLLTDFRF